MKKILFALALILGASFASYSSNYYVNDAAVDDLFANSTEVAFAEISNLSALDVNEGASFNQGKDPVVATLICWIVGGFGIHRHYLGTKGGMWAIYTFTCGGIFGIVTTVDFFVLIIDGIINKNIDKYTDNEKFFMWM
jgi:TM2 domain-containing membrane protein YozV